MPSTNLFLAMTDLFRENHIRKSAIQDVSRPFEFISISSKSMLVWKFRTCKEVPAGHLLQAVSEALAKSF